MNIKASSKYDWETIKKFNRFHCLAKNKALNIALLVLDIVCISLFVLVCLWDLLDFELVMTYVLVVFVNVMLAFVFFVLPKIQYNQNKMLHGVINNIEFEENEMSLTQSGDNTNSITKIKYGAIWRVYETKDFIYIYVNSRQAYIVDKSKVVDGTATELRVFLVKAVGMSKYKLKCKV